MSIDLTSENVRSVISRLADEEEPGWELVAVVVQRRGGNPVPLLVVSSEDELPELAGSEGEFGDLMPD